MDLDFKEFKKQFVKVDDSKEIREAINEISDGLKQTPFNPDKTSLSKLHDIVDGLQVPKTKLGRLKRRAIRQRLRTKLYLKQINLVYDKKYGELLLNEPKKDSDKKSILKANIEASINKKLEEAGYEKYKYEAEKYELQIDSYFKEIDTLISVLMDMSSDIKDKIKIMDLQKDLGVLVDIKKKDK